MKNRIIKFRAWVDGKMTMCDELMLWPNVLGDPIFGVRQRNKEPDIPLRGPVMQFTGLKDAKGVEIYEGDIIKYTDKFKGVVNLYEVVYKESRFTFKGITYTDGTKADKDFYTTTIHREEQEVIGNVFENPELINEKEKANDK